jgi:hypothetical protein
LNEHATIKDYQNHIATATFGGEKKFLPNAINTSFSKASHSPNFLNLQKNLTMSEGLEAQSHVSVVNSFITFNNLEVASHAKHAEEMSRQGTTIQMSKNDLRSRQASNLNQTNPSNSYHTTIKNNNLSHTDIEGMINS